MPSFAAGDLFSFPISASEYMLGRVVLDVKQQCIRPRKLPDSSPLRFFADAILVEAYARVDTIATSVPSAVLIPGIFIDSDMLASGKWPIVGHQDIHPGSVEFPEALSGGGQCVFLRGEVRLPLPLTVQQVETLNVYKTQHGSGLLPLICLYYLGRLNDCCGQGIANVESLDLKYSDLRFSNQRNTIYALLGENPSLPYFDMSVKYGFDVTRFYEKSVNSDTEVSLCPYCLSLITDKRLAACSFCKMKLVDPLVTVTDREYRAMKASECRICRKSILRLASYCPHCGSQQPDAG